MPMDRDGFRERGALGYLSFLEPHAGVTCLSKKRAFGDNATPILSCPENFLIKQDARNKNFAP